MTCEVLYLPFKLYVIHFRALTKKSYQLAEYCAIQHGAGVIIALSNYFFSLAGKD